MVLPVTTQEQLANYHTDFSEKKWKVTATAVTAAFLVILSLIVITSACMCLMLPNINVINSVILRGVLPGALGLIASIPLIIISFKISREKTLIRKQWLESVKTIIQSEQVEQKTDDDQVKFIKEKLLPRDKPKKPTEKPKPPSKFYSQKWIDDIIKLYPEKQERTPKQKAMVESLEKVKNSFNPKPRGKQKDLE